MATFLTRRFVLLALGAGMVGCESMPGDDATATTALLAPGLAFQLPQPAELGRRVDAVQLIEARQGAQRVAAFECRLSVDASRLLLVGTDMLGRRAMTVNWDGRKLHTEAADWLPKGLRARNMLGDIVLLFWPTEILQRSLAAAGATFDSDAMHRTVRRGGQEIVRIAYAPNMARAWNGRSTYSNLAWGYDLDIRSSEVES